MKRYGAQRVIPYESIQILRHSWRKSPIIATAVE